MGSYIKLIATKLKPNVLTVIIGASKTSKIKCGLFRWKFMMAMKDKIWCLLPCYFNAIGRFCLTLSTNEELLSCYQQNSYWSAMAGSMIYCSKHTYMWCDMILYNLDLWACETNLPFDVFFRLTITVPNIIAVVNRKYKKSHIFNTQPIDWLEERRSKTSQVYFKVALRAGMFEMCYLIRSCFSGP